MIKKTILLLAVSFLACANIFPETVIRQKRINYQGKNTNEEIPKWIYDCAEENYEQAVKELNIDTSVYKHFLQGPKAKKV